MLTTDGLLRAQDTSPSSEAASTSSMSSALQSRVRDVRNVGRPFDSSKKGDGFGKHMSTTAALPPLPVSLSEKCMGPEILRIQSRIRDMRLHIDDTESLLRTELEKVECAALKAHGWSELASGDEVWARQLDSARCFVQDPEKAKEMAQESVMCKENAGLFRKKASAQEAIQKTLAAGAERLVSELDRLNQEQASWQQQLDEAEAKCGAYTNLAFSG